MAKARNGNVVIDVSMSLVPMTVRISHLELVVTDFSNGSATVTRQAGGTRRSRCQRSVRSCSMSLLTGLAR